MDDATLEYKYRTRMSLPPAERMAIEQAYAARYGGPSPVDPTKATAEGSWGPEDLDAADAAATPLTPEPVAGPARSVNRAAGRTVAGQLYSPSEAVRGMQVGDMTREQAQRHRVRTVDPDLSVDNRVDENAIAIIAERHMASGVDRATAIAMARDHVLRAKQEVRNDMDSAPATDRSRAAEARQSRFEEDYGVATGAPSDSGLDGQDGSGRDWGNWKPGMPLPTVGGGGMRSGDDSQRGTGWP